VCGKPTERENIRSTAVGNDFVIPYCLTDEVSDLIVIVARFRVGKVFRLLRYEDCHGERI